MVEPLSVAASVVAVIQISDRIVGLCKFYIETVRDCPSDLRVILLETSTLKTIFEGLQFLADCDSGASAIISGLSGQDGPIEGCRKQTSELEKLFPPDCISGPGKSRAKKRKVKATLATLAWLFKEK